jgi:hypothetical protein
VPESDSSSDSIDPDIDELLDSAASTRDGSSESDASDVETDPSSGEQPEEQQADDEAEEVADSDSWVELLESPDSVESSDQPIQLWGRFWGEIEDVAAAFYLVLDPSADSEESIQTFRLAVYGNPNLLDDFHPRMEADQFEHRLLEYNVQSQAIPQVIFEQVEDGFRQFIEEQEGGQQLTHWVSDEDEEELRNWGQELVNSVIEEGEAKYQFRVQPVSDDSISGDDSSSPSPSPTDENETEDDSDQSGDELHVSVMNSPSSGIPADQLQEGTEIFVRIIDDRVEQLPDELIEQDRAQSVSIPMKATVKTVDLVQELPDRISDGDPEDYREVTVDLEDEYDGRALVFLEDRVKVEQQEDDVEEGFPTDEAPVIILFFAIALLVVLLIVFL